VSVDTVTTEPTEAAPVTDSDNVPEYIVGTGVYAAPGPMT
jgi:hypothetical protein